MSLGAGVNASRLVRALGVPLPNYADVQAILDPARSTHPSDPTVRARIRALLADDPLCAV